MNFKQLAGQIPAIYRTKILNEDMINKARANAADEYMKYLFITWKNYVDPVATLDLYCGSCVQNVLNNWKHLQPTLIELEKQAKLLTRL